MYTERMCRAHDSEPTIIAPPPLWSFRKLVIRRNGSWVKSQLSDRDTTRIHIRLQWDTRVGYNVYELYCPLESNGQFGPSADPAIVATTYYCSHQLHRLQQIPSRHAFEKYAIRYATNLYDT